MRTRAAILLGFVMLSLAVVPAQGQVTNRLYLLSSNQGEPYWSSDASDPDLQGLSSGCGGHLTNANGSFCLTAGFPTSSHILYFTQAALLDQPVTLARSKPLRFRFVLDVFGADDYTVGLLVQRGTGLDRSPPATEVAPGVFEGSIGLTGTLDPSSFTFFGVEMTTRDTNPRMDVRTAGQSWIELPEPVEVRGIPELRAQDAYRPNPAELRTEERLFRFNDGDYEVRTFEVDRAAGSAITMENTRSAVGMYAWLEGYSKPTLYSALRGDAANANAPTDHAELELYANGEWMAGGSWGSLAEVNVPAGTLRLDVAPFATHRTGPLKAYVLFLYGERTLRSMRWRFFSGSAMAWNLPVTSTCFYATEQLVTTPASRAFTVTLGWDSVSPTPQRWALSYSLPGVGDFPCGGHTGSPEGRFVYPGAGLWHVGATLSPNAWFVTAYDVRFEAEAVFTYAG